MAWRVVEAYSKKNKPLPSSRNPDDAIYEAAGRGRQQRPSSAARARRVIKQHYDIADPPRPLPTMRTQSHEFLREVEKAELGIREDAGSADFSRLREELQRLDRSVNREQEQLSQRRRRAELRSPWLMDEQSREIVEGLLKRMRPAQRKRLVAVLHDDAMHTREDLKARLMRILPNGNVQEILRILEDPEKRRFTRRLQVEAPVVRWPKHIKAARAYDEYMRAVQGSDAGVDGAPASRAPPGT